MPSSVTEPLSVLLVDDDVSLLRTLSDILSLHGYKVITATSGSQALDLLRAAPDPPALALVDLRLPDMSGLDLITRLRETSVAVQVIVLTGNASIDSAVAALRENSVDYLVKPVNVEQLLRTLAVAGERWRRRHLEAALRKADERFRRAVESDLFGVMFWNSAGEITDANDAFLQLVGRTREDLESTLRFDELSPPEFKESHEAVLRRLDTNGKVVPYETELLRPDGSRVPVLLGASLIRGLTDYGVCYVVDITARRRTEEALRRRERQQAAVAALGRHLIESRDLALLYHTAAALVARTLDVDFSSVLEVLPDRSSLLLRAGVGWQPDSVGAIQISTREASPAGLAFHAEQPVLVEDLPHDERFKESQFLSRHGVVSGVSVTIPGSTHPMGVVGAHSRSHRNFTQDDIYFLQAVAHLLGTAAEREQTEAAFRQAQRLEAVGRLAGGVAHDFNNLLTAISGYAQLVLAELPPDSSMREDVEEITKASRRAATLTRQLLAFSRQQVLQPRAFKLNEVVEEMQRMLHRLIGENIGLETVLQHGLPAVTADPGQIEQVIVNLVVNARDAMPDGGTLLLETQDVTLEANSADSESPAPGRYVMLAVSDTGIGMDRELRARIFEPFFTTKGNEGGTGLGLATVYGIVKQSGGHVAVYSEPGHGTTFKIYLPHATSADPPVRQEAAVSAPARGETILLVEDEETVRRLAERILRSAGYHIISASEPHEALRLSQEYLDPVHLLATDVVMPNMSGRDLATHLVATRPDTRVLYLSGYTDPGILRQGLLAVEAAFLQKPFTAEGLLAKVREVLDAEP
jgi:PAS domain S-box-containing protein